MNYSLEKLVSFIKDDEKFENLTKYYQGKKFKLLRNKGIYPYDYIDSPERLKETKLPPKEAFYSKLNNEEISDKDYEHAKEVWKTFNIKNLEEYHNLYVKSDVLLLADVFENFRKLCYKNYGLDPAWYYTTPGLSWDAMLKLTGVKLDLLTDKEMLLMLEAGTRGGISMVTKRYAKANNKYMDDYDPDKEDTFIIYLDANNLYGCAMSMELPTGGFEWMTEYELKNWRKHPCILEVDLEVPEELHDYFNEYSLAPERIKVGNVFKLTPNLNEKRNYIIHHKNLKQYLSLGLKLKKIHKGIKFKESAWLKPHIDLNTELRAKATDNKNDFEEEFFKLMNNAVYGKTLKNIRNRVDVKLITNKKSLKRYVSKPNFKHCNIFFRKLNLYTYGKNTGNIK